MSDAPDVLGKIASLAGLYKENEAALRKSIQDLSDRLAAASSGTSLTHGTETFTLAQLGPDHVVYGHLFYDEEGIRVAHRSTEDDLADLDDPSDRCFLLMTIDECPLEWLRSLTAEDAFSKLICQFGSRIDTETVKMAAEATTILELTSDPSLCVSASFEQAAKELGYDRAMTDWKEAQSAVHTDPENAITQASTLVETACKHILGDVKKGLPADQSILPLMRATCRALRLDPAEQADPELKGLCGGLITVAQNIGTLRTKFGDAHGKGPEHHPLTTSHARLAVNAAGCVTTFIMERWHAERGKTV